MPRDSDDSGGFDDQSTALQPRYDPSSLSTVAFELRIVEGPDLGAVSAIDGLVPSRTLIGKSAACGIRISDPHVSRRHAAIEVTGERLRVTDLGSKNGTRLNGALILEGFMSGGEVLQVGETCFVAQRVLGAPRRSPAQVAPPVMQFGRVVGTSAEMRRLYPLCERLAAASVPVLIEGETGTGKEVLAESIHERSPRAAGPYVVFDCTSVPANLLESELFGHERGAFTGAHTMRKGAFELAHMGTLLIDEIGDLDLAMQPKLLRVVERGEVRRVGATRPIPVDVRILAATRRDLDREVQDGRFRDDLFHRLAVTRIELPPLRQRQGDIPILIWHFWRALGGDPNALDPKIVARWAAEPWPGNVRELRNAVARQLALGDLASMHGSSSSRAAAAVKPPSDPSTVGFSTLVDNVLGQGYPLARARQIVVQEFERVYIERVLEQHGGDTAKAAAESGIARRYLNLLRSRARG